ncbi:putative membrane associated protein [Paraburkholderia fungorum]|uniref:Membrane associated protein n=1 Tax=Paraburkholderia fungorum TaxID=134537 RepID=A0AAU8T7S6_9BURK|nr:CMD domain protein [Paraburkholderia fungorum]AJZ62443.1 putative membrane associated protein [Paraburkholderia fungorum]
MTDLASQTQSSALSDVAATATVDTVDTLAGLQAGSPLAALRHVRDKVALHTQRSEDALFDPALPDLSLHERLFAAWYAARLSLADDLADAYTAKLIAAGAQRVTLDPIEAGALDPTADARLIAILSHVKLLVLRPVEARPEHLRTLQQTGVTTRGIVALSQLIAFVTYQLRVIAGLKALRAAQEAA